MLQYYNHVHFYNSERILKVSVNPNTNINLLYIHT